MRSQAMFFKARVGEKIADVRLQQNLAGLRDKFTGMRSRARTPTTGIPDRTSRRCATPAAISVTGC